MSPSQPPSRAPPTYSSAETVSDEGALPMPADPSTTGHSGGSRDITRLYAQLGLLRADLTLHGWALVGLAVAIGGIGGLLALAAGAEIGWWWAGL